MRHHCRDVARNVSFAITIKKRAKIKDGKIKDVAGNVSTNVKSDFYKKYKL
jgi:hypothetical protein